MRDGPRCHIVRAFKTKKTRGTPNDFRIFGNIMNPIPGMPGIKYRKVSQITYWKLDGFSGRPSTHKCFIGVREIKKHYTVVS